MKLPKILSSYIASIFIKKIVKQVIKDSVNVCLTENKGLGCLYYTVLIKDNNMTITELNIREPNYFLIINHTQRFYHIVKNNTVIFQGDYRVDQDPINIAEHDFIVYRHFSAAIELAALSQWKEFEHYIADNFEAIIKDIEYMDVSYSTMAHQLRLRMNT